jgi:hypothetical protein
MADRKAPTKPPAGAVKPPPPTAPPVSHDSLRDSPPPELPSRFEGVQLTDLPAAPLQTTALATRLGVILHGVFVGTIELEAEKGTIVRWEIQETFKSGRILERRKTARDASRSAAEIQHLLDEDGGFTGKLTLHCNDGAVIRIARRSVVDVAPGGTLVTD